VIVTKDAMAQARSLGLGRVELEKRAYAALHAGLVLEENGHLHAYVVDLSEAFVMRRSRHGLVLVAVRGAR
jgi:hypothetical protein